VTVQPESEDDAWRSIVEHYGDRAHVEPDDVERRPEAPDEPARSEGGWDDGWEDDRHDDRQDEERFVPPPPPPLPRLAPDRLLAWAGVFGSPALLLVATVPGVRFPAWLAYLLVAAFIGGFVYLVTRMPRGPRDPADDGARL
jgi:hypothetical protein